MASNVNESTLFSSKDRLKAAIRNGDLEMIKYVFERTPDVFKSFSLLTDNSIWKASTKELFKWETPAYKYLPDQLLQQILYKSDEFQLGARDRRHQERRDRFIRVLETGDTVTKLKLENRWGVDRIIKLIEKDDRIIKSANIHIIKY